MVKYLLASALLVASVSSYADEWTGADKSKHFLAGVAVSSIATAVAKDELHGFLAGSAVGVAKEIYDSTGAGQASLKDLAWTVAGAYLGAKLGGVIIAPTPKGLQIGLVRQF